MLAGIVGKEEISCCSDRYDISCQGGKLGEIKDEDGRLSVLRWVRAGECVKHFMYTSKRGSRTRTKNAKGKR